jgi:hypothetical protein
MPYMTVTREDETDLVFVGFLNFLDPLKPDAADRLSKLGVQVRHFSVQLNMINWITNDSMESRSAFLQVILQLLPPKSPAFYPRHLCLLNT